MDYENALAMLAERHMDDAALDALMFAEEARPNAGADQYSPEWIRPYVALAANLAQENLVRLTASTGGFASIIPQAIAPAIVRAVQLGYVEGYFAAKDG
jgi:predicted alpha/beta-hydrolase family hydrolase